MDNSGNNTILPLPSCEDELILIFFQLMKLFIPGAANCGDRIATLATMTNTNRKAQTLCWRVALLV